VRAACNAQVGLRAPVTGHVMSHTMSRSVTPLLVCLAQGLFGYQSAAWAAEPEFVREQAVNVPAWSMQVVQRHHGPMNSDAIVIDLFVVEKGKRRRLAKNIVGPIVLFEEQRRIVSCESEGSAIVGQGPLALDLNGRRVQLMKHPGYLRTCARIERSALLLLHYNLVGNGAPYNLIRVVATDGRVVLDKKLQGEGEVSVSEGGRTYRIFIPAPELPG